MPNHDILELINTVCALLTILIVSITLYLQKRELGASVAEMKEQNKINTEQLKINSSIQETNRLQRFENTFNKMLERLSISRNHITAITETGTLIQGEKAFPRVLTFVNLFFKATPTYDRGNHRNISRQYFNGSQKEYNIKKYYAEFDNIFELLFNTELPKETFRLYTRILKTYIDTPEELVLLYYHLGFRIEPDDPLYDKIRESFLFKDLNFALFPLDSNLTFHTIFWPTDRTVS